MQRYFIISKTAQSFTVSTKDSVESNCGNSEQLNYQMQEEEDAILILHGIHAAQSGSIVYIMSPDTDVFMLGQNNLNCDRMHV